MDVANYVRVQLNRESFRRPRLRLRFWSREMGSAVPPRTSLFILYVQAKIVLNNHGLFSFILLSFPRWRPSISSTGILRHQISPEFIRVRNCVPVAFTTESPLANDQ